MEAAAAGAPLLVAEGLCRRFGGLAAVQGVSFSVQPGEILGLIGPNGAGKTTTFHLLTGFLRPDAGRVLFKGQDVTHRPPHARVHLGMTRTFQIVQPFAHLSVLQNVTVGAVARERSPRRATERAMAVLEEVGLAGQAQALPGELPLAGRKRLELARALATGPTLLMLDEVMAGLNPTEVAATIELLQRVRARGVTLLLIEHLLQAVLALSDRVVVLDHGEVLAAGSPQQVTEDERVIAAYLGKEWRHVAG